MRVRITQKVAQSLIPKRRYVVTLYVTLDAKSAPEAVHRVRKSLICLENGLRYANPEMQLDTVSDGQEAR